MIRSSLALSLIVAGLLAIAAPVRAGGMATVYLDEPPGTITVGVPWSVGFLVLQHDVTPVNVESAVVQAQHRETGERLEVSAHQEGKVGHYVAEVTFPTPGSWKWSIIPAPFAGTSFESLNVTDGVALDLSSGVYPADVRFGTCAAIGDIAHSLSEIRSAGSDIVGNVHDGVDPAPSQAVAVSRTALDVSLTDLLSNPTVITIPGSTEPLACGEIDGVALDGELVVPLHLADPLVTGLAILREDDAGTVVSIYLMTEEKPALTGPVAHVEIVGSEGGWAFSPSRLEIEVGTTVVWTNLTEVSHTVAGDDLAFEDSGPFGLDETYSQTFTDPGEFRYVCGPHPFMTGVIVVT